MYQMDNGIRGLSFYCRCNWGYPREKLTINRVNEPFGEFANMINLLNFLVQLLIN